MDCCIIIRMSNFLEKRDQSGSLIRFRVPPISREICEKMFNVISYYNSYKQTEKYLPKEYLELFFKKKFFDDISTVSSQIAINEWDKKNLKKQSQEQTIFVDKPEIIEILKKSKKFQGIVFKKKYNINNFNNSLKNYIWPKYILYLKTKNFLFKKKEVGKKNTAIGVNYIEGHLPYKRNDLFWLKNPSLNKDVIYYFESKKKMNRFSEESKLTKDLKKLNIKSIKLWKWYGVTNIEFIEEAKNELKILKPKDNIEKWLIKQLILLLEKVNFWFCFFKENNIKIHFNSEEYGLSNVIRQISISKLNGCSIGKCRSVPRKLDGDWFGYYPNDTFFVWGNDSGQGVLKSKSFYKNILISGYPYQNDASYILKENSLIENKFKKNNINFVILFVDGVFAENLNYSVQNIPKKKMIEIYKILLNFVKSDKEIGLIIKSKKPELIKNLVQSDNSLKSLLNSERCHINQEFGVEPKIFSSIANVSIGVSVDMPTALIQIAMTGARALVYDFSNFSNLEKKLYEWGKNQVIFQDLNLLLESVKNLKKQTNDLKIGNWSNHLNDYDSFQDDNGGKRIGKYVEDLKTIFDKGSSSKDALDYANKCYSKNWGEDKILKQSI